jgi:outer membrane protein TolC
MKFSSQQFLICAALLAMLSPAVAQTSPSTNAGNSNGASATGNGSATASSNEGPAQDSPYPGWASQAGPVAPIPFRKFSAGVSLSANDFQGSVASAPARPGILDLSLDDAIRRGLETNLAIRLRREQQNISQGQRSLALQSMLPIVTASGSTSLSQVDLVTEGFRASAFHGLLPPGVTIPQIVSPETTTGQGNLNWSAINISALRNYQAVKIQQSVAAATTADSQQTVVLNVAAAYLQAQAAASQLTNAQALLKADQALLNDVAEEHRAGVVANIDELRARVQMQSQQQAVIAAQNAQAKANIALERMIGLDPAQQINLTETVPYAELDNQASLSELQRQAWATRADYRAAQGQVRAAEMQRKAASAERLPTLSFGGFYGIIGITYASYRTDFFAGANLNFPLFKEASLRGDRAVAQEQVTAGRAQAENLAGQIDAEIRSAQIDYDAAKSLVSVARSNMQLAQLELDQAIDQFKAGVTENLAVVDAQAGLAAAQTSLINSLLRYNVAKLEMAHALGVLDSQYSQYLRGK